VIVVLGRPALGLPGAGGARPLEGLAALVALGVSARGGTVELVGSVGDDRAGDAVAVALGRAGVRHGALLRDPGGATAAADIVMGRPAPRLDAADVELGLRYLAECRVLVVTDALDAAAAEAAMDAAAYHGAAVITVVEPGASVPRAWDRGATVLVTPDPDPDDDGDDDLGPFAGFVATFAVALADGVPAREAMSRAAAGGGWERATSE
jgi:sugar/nucleoside kinase (ribokinase family)